MKYWLSALCCALVTVLLIVAFPATDKAELSTVTINNKPSAQINFIENSWTEALKQASAKNKYIFVDAYASWCGPCKMLKATTFKDKKVVEFYNSNFINVAIDMEKGDGPQLARQWGMRAYPTLLIFTPKGKIVYGSEGYIGATDLIKFGVKALNK